MILKYNNNLKQKKMPSIIHLGAITRSLYNVGIREHLQCPAQTKGFRNVIELQYISFVYNSPMIIGLSIYLFYSFESQEVHFF